MWFFFMEWKKREEKTHGSVDEFEKFIAEENEDFPPRPT